MTSSIGLQATLESKRDQGRKILIPYLTAGMTPDWLDVVHSVVDAGADAVEVGIPFSDPMIDGAIIQKAMVESLARGTTPTSVLDAISATDIGVPVVVMTYYNVAFRAGEQRFAHSLELAGVTGAILPDLPLDEAGSWSRTAAAAGVDAVLLVAPSTPDDRMKEICEATRGFTYAIGIMGVTGERSELAASAGETSRRLKSVSKVPVCVGIGVSNAQQAVEACNDADGVVVGTALVRRVLEGAGPKGAGEFIAELRTGLDTLVSTSS